MIEQEPNGEWICPRCNRKKRTYLKPGVYNYSFCVVDNTRMIWRGDNVASDAVYCRNCEAWVEPKDFVRWTGDDMIHELCPGCDDDMREPRSIESTFELNDADTKVCGWCGQVNRASNGFCFSCEGEI